MSSSLLNTPKILLSLTMIITLLLATHSTTAIFSDIEEDVDQDEYHLDTPFAHMMRSRFLSTSTTSIKKGVNCNLYSSNRRVRVCNGVSVNKGTGLLYCCKKHCRNVLSDRNNCGKCGKKCKQCERCCKGKCTNVGNNKSNCGKCGHKCKRGLPCAYGICGYA
ncbi:protein GRIM REAPER-like [Impatiens glandulifera]|uniref:protein GRIM REAPER-like n=1 Tax=Impatiens glandulifera TaxID=253017 RepID=UPI001FB0CA99|nr:protein GRIM REAPER-like [Impatiens glandulifera]